MRRAAITALLALCAASCAPPQAAAQFQPSSRPRAETKTVSLYGWSDYIEPAVLEEFARETGVKVTYDSYESADDLDQRISASKTGYDVVITPAGLLQRHIQSGFYQKLDKAQLPHAASLSPDLTARLAAHDPGNLHAVAYMYFSGGLAYDRAKAKARLGERAPAGWDVLFNPDLIRKFADCGVEVPDDPETVFAAALVYLKINPASRSPSDLRRAADLVARVHMHVRRFTPPGAASALAGGETCLAMTTANFAFQAAQRARDAPRAADIDFIVPREGAALQIDALAVPRDAAHAADALRLIDFLLRPEIAARNSVFTQIASGVAASRALLPKVIGESAVLYPAPDVLKRLISLPPPDAAQQKLMAREWARAKTGK